MFKDIPGIIAKAKLNSVKYILAVSMYYQDNLEVLKLAQKYNEVVPALGIHPAQGPSLSNLEEKLADIDKLIHENNIQIIGEIGLDRYFIKEELLLRKQEKIFRHFLELATNEGFVINLHGKDAEELLFEILSGYDISRVIVHWFAGSPELIKAGINRGYYFSVTPAVTYSKTMQNVVELVPLDHLLSESDGPVKYKGPSPVIGEPSLMKDVVRNIAELKQLEILEVEQVLYKTAYKILLDNDS